MHSRARRRRPDRQGELPSTPLPALRWPCADRRIKLHLIKSVAVSFEQFDLLTVQSQHMVTIRRLKNPDERLDVETLSHHRQLGHRPLQPDQIGRTKSPGRPRAPAAEERLDAIPSR
jgi:hypothetical protein